MTEIRGTIESPTEVFGVVGNPDIVHEDEESVSVYVELYNPDRPDEPRQVTLPLAVGEVVVFRWLEIADDEENELVCIFPVPMLGESCYSDPDDLGNLRILDPDRANHEAYFVADALAQATPGREAPDLVRLYALAQDDFLREQAGAVPVGVVQ